MRICDLTTLWIDEGTGGGVNTYLTEKARYLSRRRDVEHVVVVPGARTHRWSLHGSTLYTIRSPRLLTNPAHRVLWNLAAVIRILRSERPTVVEVDCASPLGAVAAAALGSANVPVVGFYHVHLPFIARSRRARNASPFAHLAERLAWRYACHCRRYCDRLVVTSRDIQRRLIVEGFTNLSHVQLGVNLDLFRPGPARTGGPVTLLYVGRLSREKDLDVLVDAFEILAARHDCRLHIVGDGPLRGRLERRAARNPRIALLGPLAYGEALARAYAAADVFTLPSPSETFNLAVLEALASGLPVVGTRRGGPVDLVHPGVGALAEPGSAADFAAKVEAVMEDRGGRGQACRDYVERHFSWERTFDRLLAIYGEVVHGRIGPARAARQPGHARRRDGLEPQPAFRGEPRSSREIELANT